MSAVLRIAWREVRERRFLLAAAATLSLLALTLSLVPAPAWIRGLGEMLALVLFLAFPTAVALAVGSSLIGRDLAEGKLSFYLSRPLSSGALWAGKFLGGAVLVVGAFFCCLIPLRSATGGGLAREATGFWVLLLLSLMAFAHVITTMYRAGSWLFVLDLGLGAVWASLIVTQVNGLVLAGAGPFVFSLVGGPAVTLAVAALAMMAAAAAQLSYGRADAHRGHVALSTAIWSFALLGLGTLALRSGWVLGVTPADVGGVGYPLFAAPRGSAIFCKGSSADGRAGFSSIFLMDGQSGSYVRLRVAMGRATPPAFAVDGSTAVWLAPAASWWEIVYPQHEVPEVWVASAAPDSPRSEMWDPAFRLVVARLDQGAPVIEERPLELRDTVSRALAVDGEGLRALLSGPSSVHLVDARSGSLLASAPLSDVIAGEFLADGGVRLYQKERTGQRGVALVVLDWNAKDGSRVERARVLGDEHTFLLTRLGDLSAVSTSVYGKALLDAATGAVRAFSYPTADYPGAALMLSNGAVVLSLGAEVRIVTRDGATVASVPLAPETQVYALREPEPGMVAVGLWTRSLATRRTVLVDAVTGALRREEKEILPAGARYEWPLPATDAGSLASRLFTDLDGALIALEADGRRRVIVAAP